MEIKEKPVRPTVRLDREFNEELKCVLESKGMTFQDLVKDFLEDWVIKNKE